MIIRKSADYWVNLCYKIDVGQGNIPEQFIDKLKQAIESLSEVYESEYDVCLSPVSINKLHDFLTLEDAESTVIS